MDENAKQATAVAFKASSLQMLQFFAATWPADALLPVAYAALEALPDADIIEAFIERFGNLRLEEHSTAAIHAAAEDPILAPLQISDKWATASEEVQTEVWTIVDTLSRFATIYGVYQQIPDTVMDIINGTAMDLKSQIESGSLDLSNLNPMDLGQQILGKISLSEMQSMMAVMMANQDKMMSLISGLGGGASPDVNALLGMLSGGK